MLDVRAVLETIALGFEQEGEAFLAEGKRCADLADQMEANKARCLTPEMHDAVVRTRRRRASASLAKACERVQAATAIRLAMEAYAKVNA